MNTPSIILSIALSIPLTLALYNHLVFLVGLHERNRWKPCKTPTFTDTYLPTFSIIVPVKNEIQVIRRCLDSLLNLDYPKDKVEIIVVDGNSNDGSREVALDYAEKHPGLIKFIPQEEARGKPSALNLALKHSKNDIILVLDADSVPRRDLLMKAARYFQDPSTFAVQGKTKSINPDENLISKLASLEGEWFQTTFKGREKLGLFVPFIGSCLFIKRDLLIKLGGWSEKHLSEDMELAARLLENGYGIIFANDLVSMQEYPSTLKSYLTQRYRWLRGTFEVALSYGKLLKKPNPKRLDAEVMFLTPLMMVLFLLGFAGWLPLLCQITLALPTPLTTLMTTLGIFSTLTILMIMEKPLKPKDIFLAPLINVYWVTQSIIALKTVLDALLKRPQKWIKTEKSGKITIKAF